MGSFADGMGDAIGGMIAFGCATIVLLGIAAATLAVLWLFDIRPAWWMLHTLIGAGVATGVVLLISRVIGVTK